MLTWVFGLNAYTHSTPLGRNLPLLLLTYIHNIAFKNHAQFDGFVARMFSM